MERLLTDSERVPEKPNIWDEIVRILRRVLRWCVCCLTCGCVPVPENNRITDEMAKMNLSQADQENVLRLLTKVDAERETVPTVIDANDVQAMEVLTFSDSKLMQRVCAGCYVQLSSARGFALTRDLVIPLINLLRSDTRRIHKPALVAVGNLVLMRSENNRRLLVEGGAIKCLNNLLADGDTEIKVMVTSAFVSISTSESTKRQLLVGGTIGNIIELMSTSNTKIQKNVVGAILNLTHEVSICDELVQEGVIPPLVCLLTSNDLDLLFYVTASLCNLATTNLHRTMIMAVGFCDAVRILIQFVSTPPEKLQCQACLTLRNFTSDSDNQETVVRLGILPVLQQVIKEGVGRVLVPSLALLQNLSAYPGNWDAILDYELHVALCDVISDSSNSEAQQHSAVILRNLSSSDKLSTLVDVGCVHAMGKALLDPLANNAVVIEITAAIAVMARDEEARLQLIEIKNGGLFCKLVAMASISTHEEIQYNAAGVLGQISLPDLPNDMKLSNAPGMFVYIDNFLKSSDPAYIHIALLTLTQILQDPYFSRMFQRHHIHRVVSHVAQSSHPDDITSLAQSILVELEKTTRKISR